MAPALAPAPSEGGLARSGAGAHPLRPDELRDLNFGSFRTPALDQRYSSDMARVQHKRGSEISHTSTLADNKSERTLSGTSSEGEKSRHTGLADVDLGRDQTRSQGDNFNADTDIEKQKPSAGDGASNESEEERDPNLVDWDGENDPENPQNWPRSKKWFITISLGLTTFIVTFASSVFSTAAVPTSKLFHVSEEVMVLGVSLFVLGFAFGPIVWGPFSELYGRKPPLFTGYFIFAIFNIPVAVASNIQTVMVCRFFGGFFASAPLAVIGGALADMFEPVERGIAICAFSAATFIGPTMGPIIGGFVTMTIGWRWTQWLTLIMACFFGTLALFIFPETLAPIILQKRAKKLRFQTRNWALHSELDENDVDLKDIAQRYLLRPFTMLCLEPILLLVTIYMSLIYGILYLFFEVFPITFQDQRGWNPGVGALPFLSLMVGVLIGSVMISYLTKTRFARKLEQNGKVVPEERLLPMIIGGALLPIGLFWFAWTSSPSISPWPQIIACAPVGAGILMIFMQGLNYIIDVYTVHSNSAIAANTFARSWVGAGFPMFATGMFHNLGVPWATSLLGFLTAALFPVPILFFIYGEKIRGMSRFSAK